jgi:hypothetical protein
MGVSPINWNLSNNNLKKNLSTIIAIIIRLKGSDMLRPSSNSIVTIILGLIMLFSTETPSNSSPFASPLQPRSME